MKEIARSPSQTSEWLRCPILRTLNYKMGLKPRRLSKGDIAAIGGRGFAKGMEVYHNGTGDPIRAALAEVGKAKQDTTDKGRIVPQRELAYFTSIESRVEHATRKYVANDPIKILGFQVEDIELVLPDHGYARIDLGARDGYGLSVIDYKFKMRLEAKYYDQEVERYRNSWQQFHYTWAYSEHKGEPVDNYYICLVVAEPKFSARLHEYPAHPESMEMWKQSAERVWTQMEHEDAGLTQPWMAADHEDKFGPCPYQAACFTHRYDMNLMLQNDYVIVKDDS